MGKIKIKHYRPMASAEGSWEMALPPSKSLQARYMIISHIQGYSSLSGNTAPLPEDLHALSGALSALDSGAHEVSAEESGTAMRLLTAYIAAHGAQHAHPIRLSGRGRAHDRPIAPLVESLRTMGANINYLEREGFPPLEITPTQLTAQRVLLDASASSQYLSALLLIAPLISSEGYEIDVRASGLASAPYAEMTLECMREAGYYWQHSDGLYRYQSGASQGRIMCSYSYEGDADWTAASYAYLLHTLAPTRLELGERKLWLGGLRLPSLQGDSLHLPQIARRLGVYTEGARTGVTISSASTAYTPTAEPLVYDCGACPDLVPAVVAMCIARGQAFRLRGIAHLRIKESDRLMALSTECARLGVRLAEETESLSWDGVRTPPTTDLPLTLCVWGDHRIAMAMAPLMAALHPCGVVVEDAEVVSKSFPAYWEELRALGYAITSED